MEASKLFYWNAVMKHDANMLTSEIKEMIRSLKFDDIPESFLRDNCKKWRVSQALLREEIEQIENFYREEKLYEIQQLYKSFFCQHLSNDTWKDIIFSNIFKKDYYVKPIVDILNDSSITEFQKERKINEIFHECANAIYDKNGFFEIFLTLDEWKCFLTLFTLCCNVDFKDLIYRSLQKKEVKLHTMENISNDFSFFCYKQKWKNIFITPFSLDVVFDYFLPRSHYEDNTFFLDNRHPFHIVYEDFEGVQKDGDEQSYLQHDGLRNTVDWKDYILDVPIHVFSNSYLNEFQEILTQMLRKCNVYDFPKWATTLRESLYKIHNIVGRLDPEYNCYSYHYFLRSNLSKLEPKHIFEANDKILFPQLQSMDESFQNIFKENWSLSLDYFEKIFLFEVEKKFKNDIERPMNNFHNINVTIPEMNVFQVIHKKNYKFFKKTKINSNNDYNSEMNFIKNILDEMYFENDKKIFSSKNF